MKASASRAFTLIELLVVISIIALLSSVVLASLNAAREKGRIAAVRQFAAQSYRVAGDQAIGVWDFDDCSGTTAIDRSGFGKNGTLTNGPTWSADTPSGAGCSLSLDGVNDYVATALTKISGDGAVSVWFKTDSQTSDSASYVRPLVSQGDFDGGGGTNPQGILISMGRQGHADYGKLRFDWGTDDNYYTTSATYLDNRWHHALMSKSGTALSIYVDGVLLANHAATDAVDDSPAFEIGGRAVDPSRKFKGSIDEVRIYDKALTASDVRAIYARGTEAVAVIR